MVKNNNVIKLAFTGSTKLTLESMKMIMNLDGYEITGLFGLDDESLLGKVNSVRMDSFCRQNNIHLDKGADWNVFYSFCTEQQIDMIITLGDSRIVPKNIVNKFEVIGNHGAILPNVQGGASLVWGRMLANGRWGVSIMRIAERVDGGEILKTKEFHYEPEMTEEEFVATSDKIAIELLIQVLKGDFEPQENHRWDIRVSRHTDSYRVKEILEYCLENNLTVYLPPRRPEDGKVKPDWPEDFKKAFKIANNFPYPKWSDK
jgi:methionyl-tRNA formyltransferase